MATMELRRQELWVPLAGGSKVEAVWLSTNSDHRGHLFGKAPNPVSGMNEFLHVECALGEINRVAVGYREGGRPCFVSMGKN